MSVDVRGVQQFGDPTHGRHRSGAVPVSAPQPHLPRPSLPPAVGVCLIGLGIWAIGVPGVQPRNADGWGLASVLTWPVWAGLGLTACGVLAGIAGRVRRAPMAAMIMMFIIELYGLPPLAEKLPRTTTAWLHLGFVDQFATTGAPAHGVDSRFSWPGFFSWWGMLSEAGASDQMVPIANWTPVFVVTVAAALTGQLARSLKASSQAARLATVLFLVFNWIEQDYFSPQATGYLLALGIVVISLSVNGHDPRHRAASLALGAFSILAIVSVHQLTPAMLGLQLLALAICRSSRIGPLVWVIVAAELTWFVIGAHEFWGGRQLTLLTGDLGNVGASLGSNLTARIAAVDPGLAMVRHLRLVVFALALFLAGLGLMVRQKAGRTVLLPFLLVAAPAATVVQGYGGEMFMRCALFALPAICVLGAEALVVLVDSRMSVLRVVPVVLVTALCMTLVVLRGGNDSFSYVSQGEVRLVQAAIAVTSPSETLLMAEEQGPIRTARVSEIKWRNVTVLCGSPALVVPPSLASCAGTHHPHTIVVTRSMERWGEIVAGRPTNWAGVQVRRLLLSREYRLLIKNDDGLVLVRQDRRKVRVP